ncbi:MAG: hypothetical protein QXD77_02325, partial [Candidatus Aenigmatarchaeota archaeon]
MKDILEIIDRSLTMDPQERARLKVLLRTASGRPAVFFSIKFYGPNYYAVVPFHVLAELAKTGCNVVIMFRDISTFEEPEKFVKSMTDEEFVDYSIDYVYNMLLSFGAPKERIFIYKFSDLWNRLMEIREPNLFFEYYKITGDRMIGEFITSKTLEHFAEVRHILQNPADVMIADFFGKLAPESGITKIHLMLGRSTRRKFFYEETRKILFQKGLIKDYMPAYAFFGNIPRTSRKGELTPNIYFDEAEIFSAMKRDTKLSMEKDIPQLMRYVIRDFVGSYEIEGKKVGIGEVLRFLKNASKDRVLAVAARNMYLSNINLRKIMKITERPYPVKICGSDEMKGLGI